MDIVFAASLLVIACLICWRVVHRVFDTFHILGAVVLCVFDVVVDLQSAEKTTGFGSL